MKIANSILGDRIFNKIMKATFYGHFGENSNNENVINSNPIINLVAGEDQDKIVPCLERCVNKLIFY